MKDPKGPTRSYKTAEEIASKHKVSVDEIKKQVKIGTEVEFEHTTSRKNAEITALQHLDELPDYYTRLKKMESKKSPVKESIDNNRQLLAGKRYCLLCNKHETESECSWGPVMWRKYSIASIHPANESYVAEDHKEIASGKKKDEEGYMARVEFDQIERSISVLRKLVKKGDQQLPAWVQSKITRAADFIDTAAEYMSSDESISESKTYDDFILEVAAWQKKEGKNREGGLNEKGRKSYEEENPGSDLKAPSKTVGNPRRASFCARMSGMKKKLTSKKTANDPNSRINKSLRAWNC
jgi:hypothetical protein